jgi:hypothetical protein
VNEETRSRLQRSEERKAQIEALKAAKFNCRRLMLEISRSMPAAALQGDAYRLCTQSDLKAQIKRLQEVGAYHTTTFPYGERAFIQQKLRQMFIMAFAGQ